MNPGDKKAVFYCRLQSAVLRSTKNVIIQK